ncbi:MAG: heme ABC exporter ATP-binding protein CcmA [Hyphomicrobiales bacterium]|nr:heme ABC exporter ATP-binding protein CcmA [Hyphomicrobiales bacterium]
MISITIQRLRVERSERRILDDLSFELTSGTITTLTGPNGVGKSTLLRALAGLLPLAGGSITASGLRHEATLGESCHYLGHTDGLKNSLSVAENLEFWAAMLGGGGIDPAAALAEVGLQHVAEFSVGYLSAGQRRRVALARLLVAHRPVWLLDEPTTALDASAQRQCAAMIAAHAAGGGIVLAATHAPLGLAQVRELAMSPQPTKTEDL